MQDMHVWRLFVLIGSILSRLMGLCPFLDLRVPKVSVEALEPLGWRELQVTLDAWENQAFQELG